MRRYEYIGRDGSSGYRTGKKYWGRKYTRESGKTYFIPLSYRRNIIEYTSVERFKADWE